MAKGLKFCPTPVFQNKDEKNKDIDEFCRRLRLREHFHDMPNDNNSIMHCESSWIPESGKNLTLDKSISFLKLSKTSTKPKPKPKRVNLNHEERGAITSLTKHTDLVIKEADKGAAVVLMDSDYYKEKIMHMLNDRDFYKHIPHNIDKTTIRKIKETLNHYQDCFTKKEISYLTNFEYKTSLFYGLPKVHKSAIIIKAIEDIISEYINVPHPTDLKMRPIVAGPACPTHRLSHVLDIVLQPLQKFIPSYIKNNIDFLNKIPSQISDSEVFITLDVTSLYSNIRHELGYEAIRYWLELYYESPNGIPSSFIMESCKLILENNSFEFNGLNYLQVSGTAMGTKFAPSYANLVLGYLEKNLYVKLGTLFGQDIALKIKKNYMRYLDDVFMIWDKRDGSINAMIDLMNTLDEKINFTCDNMGNSVTFLDIKLVKTDNTIITDIHYKATDTKQYLEYNSNHPRHVKNNIPFNLARRICTIVSDASLRDKRLDELKSFLFNRKYPINLIESGISRALKIPISELRSPSKTNSNALDKIPYISTYNPNYDDHFNEIKSVFNMLQISPETENIFKEVSLVKSKRQPRNLKSILTRARFNAVTNQQVRKCGNQRCLLCSQIIEGAEFHFKTINYTFKIKDNMDCSTLNCVYVLQCNGCSSIYIGETSNFRMRTNLHRDHVRNNKGLYVNKHVYQCAKNKLPNFSIMPFYKVKKDDPNLRKNKESYFIERFKPPLNRDNDT